MARSRKQSSGQVRKVALASIRPSPVNDSVYRPPAADDADIQEMARSMREHGVLDHDAFTAEQERERADAVEIGTARAKALAVLGPIKQ